MMIRTLVTAISVFCLLTGPSVSAKTEYYACQVPDQKLPPQAKYSFSGYNRQTYIYKNNQFGYQLLFPKNWNGLKVFETKDNPTNLSLIYYHYFALPYKNPQQKTGCYQDIFSVYVYTNQQWEKIKDEEGPIQYFLGDNDKYTFVLELTQSFGDESFGPYWNEVLTTIAPTFKTFNP